MSRRLAILGLVLLAVPLSGQSPAPATAPLQVPFRQFQLANGLNVICIRTRQCLSSP